MNSIKRITSAEAPTAAVATFAIAALAIIVLGVTETMASAATAKSSALLQAAELKPRGQERDSLLAAAHEAAVDARGLAPRDAQLVAQDARILYLQATTAAVPEVSIPLLDAAKAAAEMTLKASRGDAGAHALLALVEMARLEGPSAAAAADVTRSYGAPVRSADVALWRGEAAAGAWPLLSGDTRIAAATETCALQRSPDLRARAQATAALIDAAMGSAPGDGASRVCGLTDAEIATYAPPKPAAPHVEARPADKKKKKRGGD